MSNTVNNPKLWDTRKKLLQAWTTVGSHLSQANRPKGASQPQYSISIEDALWAFEWRNPLFCAELRRVLDLIPMRDGTFTFQYGFVCQTIVGWNGKVPNAGDKKIDEILADTKQLVKQYAHAAGEFRTLLLEYREVGFVNLCRMIVNQRKVV